MAQKPLDFEKPATLTVTPAGIEIAYFVEPRRAYAVRLATPEAIKDSEIVASGDHPWREVPSVTTVLKALDKPALPWWGMKVGVEGVMQLIEMGAAKFSADPDRPGAVKLVVNVEGTWQYATTDNVIDWLKKAKLTTNHVVKEAGERGQNVHDAFEAWAVTGKVPNPAETYDDGRPLYSPDELGYVEGLRKFVVDVGDGWETTGSEIAVASIEHGFAGRYDLRGKFTKDVTLITRACTLAGEPLKRPGDRKAVVIPEGTSVLADLKTSKGIYPTHLIQLEAYEGGGVECGLDATDARAVLHVTKDGLYEFKRARATYEDFLAVLRVYNTVASVTEALK